MDQLLVCPDGDLTRYFRQEEDTPFFAVTVDGVRRYVWTEKGLVSDEEAKQKTEKTETDQMDRHNP